MKLLALCFFFYLVTSSNAMAAAEVNSTEVRIKPGFLYTRPVGKCATQHWPKTVPRESSVAKVFGSTMLDRYEAELTMWDATRMDEEDAFSKLVKQASVALVNSYTRPAFPFRPWEVKSLVFQALVSESAAVNQARVFQQANADACA